MKTKKCKTISGYCGDVMTIRRDDAWPRWTEITSDNVFFTASQLRRVAKACLQIAKELDDA